MRSYTPRFRVSDLTRSRLDSLLPAYGVTALPVNPEDVFGRPAETVLEIGSGHGGAAIAYADTHPEHDVLAAEVHVPGVARMLAAADEVGVRNLRVYVGDALDLLTGGLPDGSLARVHVFFPDPWPKRRHEKRRLVQRHTLDRIADVLVPGGTLLVATTPCMPTTPAHNCAFTPASPCARSSVRRGSRSKDSRRRDWRPGVRRSIWRHAQRRRDDRTLW